MAPDLHQLLDLLKSHFPWLAPLLFWMGLSRAIFKLFNAPLQRFLTAVAIEAARDSFDINQLLQNRWYRLIAYILDYLLSFKLPSAQITFMPAGSYADGANVGRIAAVLILALIFAFGCASRDVTAPVYSPLPPANTNRWQPLLEKSRAKGWSESLFSPLPPVKFLSFSNPDRGPLFYQLESTTKLSSPWRFFTNGVAHPGLTRITFSASNPKQFFRVCWVGPSGEDMNL